MADISLCTLAGRLKECETCKRNQENAKPNSFRQSWIPPKIRLEGCMSYMGTEGKKDGNP